SAFLRVGPAAIALRNESPRADGSRSSEQGVGDFSAKPVGERELLIELPEVSRRAQRGQLMDDDLGLGATHRGGKSLLVERIGNYRSDAQLVELARFARRAR